MTLIFNLWTIDKHTITRMKQTLINRYLYTQKNSSSDLKNTGKILVYMENPVSLLATTIPC